MQSFCQSIPKRDPFTRTPSKSEAFVSLVTTKFSPVVQNGSASYTLKTLSPVEEHELGHATFSCFRFTITHSSTTTLLARRIVPGFPGKRRSFHNQNGPVRVERAKGTMHLTLFSVRDASSLCVINVSVISSQLNGNVPLTVSDIVWARCLDNEHCVA